MALAHSARTRLAAVSAAQLALSLLLLSPLSLLFLSSVTAAQPPAYQAEYNAGYQAPPPPTSPPPPGETQGYTPPSGQANYGQAPQPPVQNYAAPDYAAQGMYGRPDGRTAGGTPPYSPPPQAGSSLPYAASYAPAAQAFSGDGVPSPPRKAFVEGAPHVAPPPVVPGGDSGASRRKETGRPLWQETVGSVELPRHSWAAPLDFESIQGDWDIAMATVPAERYLVLTPAVANRTGQFWHRQPLKTTNFEVQFGFGVYGDDKAYVDFAKANARRQTAQSPQDAAGSSAGPVLIGKPEGFAFWYVYDEYAKVFPKSPEEEKDWTLMGYKNRPRGLGVFFKMFDRYGQLRPSISVFYNEHGTRALDPLREIPLPAGVFYRYRNLPEPAVFKLAAGPAGVVGEIRTSSRGPWLTCFHLKDVRLNPGGFIGFTAYNGPEAASLLPTAGRDEKPGGGIADLVVLYFVKLWNLDLSVRGEDDAAVAQELSDVPVDDMLKFHSFHKDDKALADALKQLTRMMYKHIAEQTPREQAMQRTINSLLGQVTRLSTELRDMKKDILTHLQKATPGAGSKVGGSGDAKAGAGTEHALHTVRTELHGLKNLLAQHSQIHRDSLHTLQQKVEAARATGSAGAVAPELRELANRARELEATIAAKEHFSFFMTVGMILVLLAFAVFVWKRFRDMEKKHLL